MNEALKKQELVIFKGPGGKIELRTDIKHDTIWATQAQIAEVFQVDRSVITKHISNIFEDDELQEKSNVQKMHFTSSDKPTNIYNLNVILAVGYRVNSQKATQFRIWATSVLHEHLLKGYTLNKKRLEKSDAKLGELNKMIGFITNVRNKRLSSDEASGLLTVIKEYADSWLLLHKYDQGEITVRKSKKKSVLLGFEEVEKAIAELKTTLIKTGTAADVFGQERGEGLRGILQTLGQTFGGKELYASLEEKAAHLLYFVIKDHPLVDGNKRTGALLFILFLQKNAYLFRANGEKKINDNTLTALALLIAESKPQEKDQMVALITQLLK